ncbi:MAG TPA: dipeptidase [Actinomycetota bacterium]|nr:dipeptidase [Actinomycetota bacterium]
MATESNDPLLERARDLLRRAPVIDGHNDVLWELRTKVAYDLDRFDLAEDRPELMTDLPRARSGGLGGQFWSVYVPSDMPGDTAVTATLEQIDGLHAMLDRYPDALRLTRTADEVERAAVDGVLASMVGVEGGQSIGGSLGALRMLARMGAGYMTLTHNHNTRWADSATDEPEHGGLTRFGEEVVREMNRCGVLVDLSHVSADTMANALDVTETPVIFSHSSARAVCGVPRNVPDDILRRVPGNGGVVMVTFVPMFVIAAGEELSAAYIAEAKRIKAEHPDDPYAAHEAMEAWFDRHEMPPAHLTDVADHIDHVRDVAGIDHLGIGSDFDGSSSMPEGLEDVSKFPNLFAELLRRGYSEEDLAKIARGNILRVMRENERIASRLRRERAPSLARIDDRAPEDDAVSEEDAAPEERAVI